MGRSKPRRAGARAVSAPPPEPLLSPRAAPGVVFEPLTGRAEEARQLLSYTGAWAPPPSPGELAWGARREGDQALIGAVLLERKGATGMLHGPVVVLRQPPDAPDPVEIAAGLLAALLKAATGSGVETLFARPQGLDRVWVRFGFVPVPEVDLPGAFRRRPGTGLFAWRGGTALWSSRKPQTDSGPVTAPPHPTSPQRGEEKR